MFIVGGNDTRTARAVQTLQRIQQGKRVRAARACNKQRTRRIEKIMCAQNTFEIFQQDMLPI